VLKLAFYRTLTIFLFFYSQLILGILATRDYSTPTNIENHPIFISIFEIQYDFLFLKVYDIQNIDPATSPPYSLPYTYIIGNK
jgi:hypothetical protein